MDQEVKEKNVTKQETAEQMIKDHGVPDQDAGMVFQDAAIDEDILRAVLSMKPCLQFRKRRFR